MTILVDKPKTALEHIAKNGPIERYRIGGSTKSIRLKKGKKLDGTDEIFVDQVVDGSIIKLFDKTPFPENGSDVVCPHFLELKWANGCYFDCAWCYLKGTFRFQERGKSPYLKPREKIESHLKSLYDQWPYPTVLNSGELSDSLVFEGHDYSLSKNIIPLFKSQKNHKLLILTKSLNVNGVLESGSQDVVIPSFSLNAYDVAKRWENQTPHPRNRIESARKLFKEGYAVRIRIDPMVPIEGWKKAYLKLVDDLFENLHPERITLGSLRGLQSTINNCEDRSWVEYLENGRSSNWGKKITDDTRQEMYQTLIDYLSEKYSYETVALCKETVIMWKKLKKDYTKIRCNCIF